MFYSHKTEGSQHGSTKRSQWVLGFVAAIAGAVAATCGGSFSAAGEQLQEMSRDQQPNTSFTYRGQLLRHGLPVTDYVDFEVTLWDDAEDGTMIGHPQWVIGHPVLDGLFSLTLDFGIEAHTAASQRWIEIAVLSSHDTAPVTLVPRQRITNSPSSPFPTHPGDDERASVSLDGASAPDHRAPDQSGAAPQGDDSALVQTHHTVRGMGGVPGSAGDDDQQDPMGDPLWNESGSDIYFDTGNVGIGTSTPSNPLQVENSNANGTAIVGWARSSGENLGVYGLASGGEGTGVFGLAKSESNNITYGGRFESKSNVGRGVYGLASATSTDSTYGGWFQSNSSKGRGVQGYANSTTGKTYGGLFQSDSESGYGVYAYASSNSGTNYALYAKTNSNSGFAGYFTGGKSYFGDDVGIGTTSPSYPLDVDSDEFRSIVATTSSNSSGATAIRGKATSTLGTTYGLYGLNNSKKGRGVYGYADSGSGTTYGVYGLSDSEDGRGVYGEASASVGDTFGVYGYSASTVGIGVYGYGDADIGPVYGVMGKSDSESGRGVYGYCTSTSGVTSGVYGMVEGGSAYGLNGYAKATSGYNFGAMGMTASTQGTGVKGYVNASSGTNYGVYGITNSTSGYDFYAAGAGVDYGTTSSRRWKRHITPIDDPLAKLERIRGVYFDWDAEHGGHHDVGMIAEEVGEVLPEIVNYEENGIDASGMDYGKTTPLLVEAVKALRAEKDAEIEAQQQEISDLRQRVADLETMVQQLAATSSEGGSQ
ncbi:MAG: tail fiber domain-containing protein [Planctomycetes bacterium]|nr:tail fiber domain-containing protein [Planctomycetota bacterium]NOG54242.1 tail fiber domain-containing protein [Planctomycetota bacterium]